MTDEQKTIEDLSAKVEILTQRLNQVLPIIETLGEMVLFRKMEADEILGLNKQTLSKSNRAETFEEMGARRVYVNLKSLTVYSSKKPKKRAR